MESSNTFVTVRPEARRVDVVVDGDLDAALLNRITDEVLTSMSAHGVFGVLVDLRAIAAAPPPSALARLPEQYAARNADKRMAIAIVLPPRGDRLDLSRFYKLAASRRAYRVNIFDEVTDAERWLADITR